MLKFYLGMVVGTIVVVPCFMLYFGINYELQLELIKIYFFACTCNGHNKSREQTV